MKVGGGWVGWAAMPHRFRTRDGKEWTTGVRFPLFRADGTELEGMWAGCARREILSWWLGKAGNELVQSAEVAGIGIKGEDDGILRWDATPEGARLFFVLEPPKVGKNGESYRIAKMVTTAATPEQLAYFRDERYALLGGFDGAGEMATMPPLAPPDEPPPALPPAQGELF